MGPFAQVDDDLHHVWIASNHADTCGCEGDDHANTRVDDHADTGFSTRRGPSPIRAWPGAGSPRQIGTSCEAPSLRLRRRLS